MRTKQEKAIEWAESFGYPDQKGKVILVIVEDGETILFYRNLPTARSLDAGGAIIGIFDINNKYHEAPNFEDDKPFDVIGWSQSDEDMRIKVACDFHGGRFHTGTGSLMRWVKSQTAQAIEASEAKRERK